MSRAKGIPNRYHPPEYELAKATVEIAKLKKGIELERRCRQQKK